MRRHFPVSAFLAVFFLWAVPSTAFSRSVLWTDLYDGPGGDRDQAKTISVFGDTVYATGFTRDFGGAERGIVRAYSRAGVFLWTVWGDFIESEFFASAVDNAGNLYVAGRESVPSQSDSLLVSKIASEGQVLWTSRPMASGYTVLATQNPLQAVLRGGTLYVMGTVQGHPTDNQAIYVVAMLPDDGSILWETVLTGPGAFGNAGAGIAATDDDSGGVIIALAGTAQDGAGGAGVYAARLNAANGSRAPPGWEAVLGNAGPGSQARGMVATSSGIYVAGIFEDPGAAGEFSAGVVALDLSGNETWRDNTVTGSNRTGNNRGSFILAAGGAIYVAGLKDNGTLDTFVRAYRAGNGALLWNRDISGLGLTGGPGFLSLSDTNLVLGGLFPNSAGNGYTLGIRWVDASSGGVIDAVSFPESDSSNDLFFSGAVDLSGCVYTAARIDNSKALQSQDFFVGVAGVPPSAAGGGGGGGGCSLARGHGVGIVRVLEFGVLFAPAVILWVRRKLRGRGSL